MPKGECSPEYDIVPANIEYYQKTKKQYHYSLKSWSGFLVKRSETKNPTNQLLKSQTYTSLRACPQKASDISLRTNASHLLATRGLQPIRVPYT